jgi:predicted dehydrogenase
MNSNHDIPNPMSRRTFMEATVSAVAVGLLSSSLQGQAVAELKRKLNVACIGVGVQGETNLKNVSQTENIIAICDVDDRQANRFKEQFPGAKYYQDYRKMFAELPEIDAVVVSTPDHAHFGPVMAAIAHGKHVYCEKPLAHTVEEVQLITRAARAAGVKTQLGIQGHSSEHIRRCCEWIWDGAIGEVREINLWCDRPMGGYCFPSSITRPGESLPVPESLDWDAWLGPASSRPYHPIYHPILWRGWYDFGTGSLGDMGTHIMDPAFWALNLGSPVSVEANVTYNPDYEFWKTRVDGANHWPEWNAGIKEYMAKQKAETYPAASIIRYQFPARKGLPPVKVTWYDGGLLPPIPDAYPRDQPLTATGAFIIGDKGVITHASMAAGLRLLPESKMEEFKRVQPKKTIERVTGHYADWISACNGGKDASANFEYGGPLTEMVLLGVIAMRVPNKKLLWDDTIKSFTNDERANDLLKANHREGWKI